MATDAPPRKINKYRSSSGCWTCRLRRKKCDEQHPVCDCCDALNLTCHYGDEKPDWMDGGAKQEEMAEFLRRKVKERGHRRFGNRHHSETAGSIGSTPAPNQTAPQASNARDTNTSTDGRLTEPCALALRAVKPRRVDCKPAPRGQNSTSGQPDDSLLTMFYIDHVFPFLFPFYQPSLLQGGRAWLLEMMMKSPVVRRAALCQSSYFFSLSRGGPNWETVLAQTKEAFELLQQALQVISGSDITEHLHGAARVMASIMQVQRFEIAVLSFDNCQAHLRGALALFRQLLDSARSIESLGFNSSFEAAMHSVGPQSWSEALYGHLPSAEQAAFHFSSTLLIFDDIVASTVLQEQPQLYEYHHSLLVENIQGTGPVIDLESVVGCQNWVLVQIGEIAVLDAWKQRCKRGGTLDVMESVRRATCIKSSLETGLTRLQTSTVANSENSNAIFDIFAENSTASQKPLVTLAWAYSALIYLSVVVSGWQPASVEIRHLVRLIVEESVCQVSPPALLRTMVWPICVAGCLAEPELAIQLREIIESLQPPSVFGTLRKALKVMEAVWRNDNAENLDGHDLATCFRYQGDLVLLV
ncbi:fungal-specific transcription factor domain-containing protein [Xylaria bambusicola]|uniref:fungal-specific transcription factor domain-containing protein n=1 Tax=Xylaria bambusicola TaxID=326684 RepID=UPI002007480D|nr:fungal-specific transcription factor domain-containing protein [Xylaria bambusicola]KAI0505885.1 fungal-specific transcription factor domain-containing protein [Xylaria bambusicola]